MNKLLVVDDDPAMLLTLKNALADSGMDVRTAAGGREAIEELCRATLNGGVFDIVLVDVAMPGINGWRVLDAVKANPLWAEARVIVMSGYSQSPQALMRVARYDGIFIEKDANFHQMVTEVLGRFAAASAMS